MKVKITTVCNFSLEVLYFPNMNNSSQNKINLLEKVDNTQEILDLLGKEIHTQQVNSQKTTINLSKYSKGIYLIKFSNDLGSKVYKIIKE